MVSSLFLRVSVKNNEFLPEYIALYFNSAAGQNELRKYSRGCMPSITKAQLENVIVPRIPIVRQKKLINLNDTFNEWKRLCSRQMELQSKIINDVANETIGVING
jgi:restriction endonuclease S subunit